MLCAGSADCEADNAAPRLRPHTPRTEVISKREQEDSAQTKKNALALCMTASEGRTPTAMAVPVP